jgi:predicted CoA-substrate-specific enzyme activase
MFADTTITEITCHTRGVIHQMPEAKTIIDIGGQDSKLIRLERQGVVRDFVMNDRCAAGTGKFLEVVANQLEMDILDLGRFAEQADKPAVISSMCVVFAETEILGLLASGESRENITAGVQMSIATRIASMGGRQMTDPVVFTGGVALIPGMADVLEKTTGHPVFVAQDPQFTGAKGAAILATEQC